MTNKNGKEKMSLWVSGLLAIALICTTIAAVLSGKRDELQDDLTDKKIKMIIESSSATMYDARVSTRSLENVIYNSSPSSRKTIEQLLAKINETPKIRYGDELLNDAKKRNIHVTRFNTIADELNKSELQIEKSLNSLNSTISSLHFFEVLCIIVAIILSGKLIYLSRHHL